MININHKMRNDENDGNDGNDTYLKKQEKAMV
jgi:hypothetical protein